MNISNPYADPRKSLQRDQDHEESSSDGTEEGSECNALAPQSETRIARKTSSASALIISACAKAGMDGIDRSKIDAIILRESGDSKFMQQQRKRDEKVNQRIESFRHRVEQASPRDYAVTPELDQWLQTVQNEQATRSTCVVVDMDMFYMACELLTKPELKERPACVGSGMILTSNYLARKFGVRSAMPGFIGDKLVDELSGGKQKLVHVRSNFDLYKQKSRQVVEALKEFDPNLKSYSLDEAYLDLGPYLALYVGNRSSDGSAAWTHDQIRQTLSERASAGEGGKSPSGDSYKDVLHAVSSMTCRLAAEAVVHHMRTRVNQVTSGLTCSAGIAPNFTLAKIASDANKPNGQLFVDPNGVLDFVRPLPVRKVPGIGRVTEKILHSCNIVKVADMYEQRGLIYWLFKPATRESLLRASVGCSGTFGSSFFGADIEEDTPEGDTDHQKGISKERTFSPNDSWVFLNAKLEDIAHMLSKEMVRKKILAHTITVKVKLDTFDVWSRSKSLARGRYAQSPQELMVVISPLLSQIRNECMKQAGPKTNKRFSCRLLGVRCSDLIEEDACTNPQQETMEKYLKASPSLSLTRHDEVRVVTPYHPPKASNANSGSRMPHNHSSLEQPTPNIAKETDPATNMLGTNQKRTSKKPANSTDAPGASLKPEMVACPLCQRNFSVDQNDALNKHIDTCLSAQTVRDAVQEAFTTEDNTRYDGQGELPQAKKRQRLTDFW